MQSHCYDVVRRRDLNVDLVLGRKQDGPDVSGTKLQFCKC